MNYAQVERAAMSRPIDVVAASANRDEYRMRVALSLQRTVVARRLFL